MRACILAATAAAALASFPDAEAKPAIKVSNKKTGKLSPLLYSMFFETEINFGGEGGLYAEMVRNRDFEALGRGNLGNVEDDIRLPHDLPKSAGAAYIFEKQMEVRKAKGIPTEGLGLDPYEPPAVLSDPRPWTTFDDATRATMIHNDAPFASNPASLSIQTFSENLGVSNPGYWGMSLKDGMTYKLSFYAKADLHSADQKVYVQLVCGSGEAVATSQDFIASSEWESHTETLKVSGQSCTDGSLRVMLRKAGQVVIDHVSLFPGDAVLGLFRKDLFDLLKAYQPPLMRIPGGNYMEGQGERTRWKWKKSIGPREQRTGHYNTAWGYWVTDGLGLAEMLMLMNALKTEPQLAVFTGFFLSRQYIPLADSAYIVQDAMDLIEYVNGSSSTPWGQKRAEGGIPTPVKKFRLEVGNEEVTMTPQGYPGHYKIITDAIWDKYPSMYVVASGDMAIQYRNNRTKSCFPCVGGCGMGPQKCDAWDEHTYDSNDNMASMGNLYDDYHNCVTVNGDPCPLVNVLEYAANEPVLSLQGAIAESIFLIGIERNSRYVTATAYAPLFDNVNGQQWTHNLINLNQAQSFAIPSYYLQTMLKKYTANDANTLLTQASGEVSGNTWNATSSVDRYGNLAVKIGNYGPNSVFLNLTFDGFSSVEVESYGEILTSEGGSGAQNTFQNSTYVTNQPVRLPQQHGHTVSPNVPAWSVYVLKAKVE